MMNRNLSHKLSHTKEPFLRRELGYIGFTFIPNQYAFWRATDGGATLTFFRNGTLLIQGKKVDDILNFLMSIGILPTSDRRLS